LVESCTVNNELPEGLSWNYDTERQTLTVSGTPTKAGTTTRLFTLAGKYNTCKASVRFVIREASALDKVIEDNDKNSPRYDLLGRQIKQDPNGIYIQNGQKITRQQ